eukprot:6213472-Pleurochrysis_carterae.AAC.4
MFRQQLCHREVHYAQLTATTTHGSRSWTSQRGLWQSLTRSRRRRGRLRGARPTRPCCSPFARWRGCSGGRGGGGSSNGPRRSHGGVPCRDAALRGCQASRFQLYLWQPRLAYHVLYFTQPERVQALRR